MCVGVEGVQAPQRMTNPTPDKDSTESFEALYQAEYRPLLALAFTLTGSRAAAEELVQETFLRVCLRWNRLAAYDRPGGFARRVLLNLATSRARRLAAEARALARLDRRRATDEGGHVLSSGSAEFWAAVRSLPRRQAEVLSLHYLEDRSVNDVANILGCSEVTVRSHLHTGRKRLAAVLGLSSSKEIDHNG